MSTYTLNFIKTEESFCGRTDGDLRPALLGRLCRRVDLERTDNTNCKHHSDGHCPGEPELASRSIFLLHSFLNRITVDGAAVITGWMTFLSPRQRCQSTGGNSLNLTVSLIHQITPESRQKRRHTQFTPMRVCFKTCTLACN